MEVIGAFTLALLLIELKVSLAFDDIALAGASMVVEEEANVALARHAVITDA